jgi:hypothetical protein
MSNWRVATFSNEEACDWLDDLLEERDVYFIHNTLEIIADYPPGEKPESWDCCCALAAAEMVAAARGNPSAEFPMVARDWLEAYGLEIDDEILALAGKALDRVQEDSFLKDEFSESGELAQWQSSVNDLRKRCGIT